LADAKRVDDHWYPKDPQKRAKVDQFLNWYYLAFRKMHEGIIYYRIVAPKLNVPIKQWKLDYCENAYPGAMAGLEKYLEENEYVAGPEMSIADFYAVTAVAGQKLFNFDRSGYPKVCAWYDKLVAIPEIAETIAVYDQLMPSNS
jgi:glutathione S-transferase